MRKDQRSNVVPLHRDGLANLVTGAGTGTDRNIYDQWWFMPMDQSQLMAAYRSNWLVGKVIDIPAEDMVREWRNWQAKKDQIEKLEEAEKKFGIIGKVQNALAMARLCGGAAILLGFGDANPMNERPRNLGLESLKYVHVFNRFELSIGQKNQDVASPWYGQPYYFRVAGNYQSSMIHPSRMVVFHGAPVPTLQGTSWEDQFWGDSVVQRIDRAVKNAVKANDGFARLIDEAKIDVYRMAGFIEQLAVNESAVRQRVEYTDAGKSSLRGVYLDAEDEFTQRQLTLTGMPEMIETLLAVVAGAADIPATRLLGRAPQGMNATGEHDEKNYHTMIRSKQKLYLSPTIDQLDDVLIPSALGTDPASINYKWNPLTVMSDKELAEIEYKDAQTLQIYVNSGLVPDQALAKAVHNRMIESQRWPGFEQELESLPDMNFEPDGTDPSAITQPKGGDQNISAGQGGAPGSSSAARRAANDSRFEDATPRTLYVSRDVVNVSEIAAWAKKQGLPALQDDLHVTIAYSTKPIDWMKIESEDWNQKDDGTIEIPPGGVRIVEPLGDRTAVLLFTSSRLTWRHAQIIRAGASHGYPDYQPHISLTGDPVDLANVEPYRGKIVLGPEIFEEVND